MFKLIFMIFYLNGQDPSGPFERAEVFDTFTDCMAEAVNFALEADRHEGEDPESTSIQAIAVSCVRIGEEAPKEI